MWGNLPVPPTPPLHSYAGRRPMSDLLRVACVQLTSGPDKAANLEKAERLVARAAATGADLLALEGAELVSVPAHFTTPTGKDHWHVLLRARAIENQYYLAAPAQVGETLPGRPSYGRSLIVDPWGIVLAQAPDEETVISAELDRARLSEVRAKLPSLKNRQAEAYRWPSPV